MTDTEIKVRLDRGGLFAKLAEILGEVGSIPARGRNDFLGTNYILEDDVLDAVRSKLAERRIVVLPGLGSIARLETKTAKGKDTALVTAEVAFTFCDGDSGETWTCQWAGVGEDIGDKGLTKAETSALRTFLLKTFLISAQDTSTPRAQVPARTDGQAPITEEQYAGLLDAFRAAGEPFDLLHTEIDKHGVPRTIEGRDLSPDERVMRLASLDAIKVHKALVAAAPSQEPAR